MSSTTMGIGSNATRPSSPVSAARREAVDKARQGWIRKLIDLSRRNNLLYYRPLKTGTLDLSSADPVGMAALLSGSEPIAINKLLANWRDEAITNLVREIARRALANAEEKGLQTLFIALGMATWSTDDGGRPADAPVLLFPVILETKGSHSFFMSRAGAVQVNLVLLHVLTEQFGVSVTAEALIPHLLGDNEDELFDPSPLYAELCKRASDVPGFAIRPCSTLGNFAFQKMAMVKDLQERGNELAEHDIVAAIAGDKEARSTISTPNQDMDPRQLDHTAPDNEFIVLDADSSQQCAIANVLSGESAVIHGPPGTGKSQTIANLVATLAANGHRVLFVAEKRAALEVVLRRLSDVGLAHLAIDLHGADLAPKKVMQQVADALGKVRNAVAADCDDLHKHFVDRRNRLNDHVYRLHVKREPTRLSIFEMQGKLLRLGEKLKTATRWRGEELLQIKPDIAVRVRDLLAEAADFEPLFLRIHPSPWTGAKLPSGLAVEKALDLVQRIKTQSFPGFMAALHSAIQQSGLDWPISMTNARELISLVSAVQSNLNIYAEDIYVQDHSALLHSLTPGKSGGFAAAWAWLSSSEYRRARKAVRAVRTAGPVPVRVLFAEIEEVKRQTSEWRSKAISQSLPHRVDNFASSKMSIDLLFADATALDSILWNKRVEQLAPDQFGSLINNLVADNSTPQQIPKLTQIENDLDASGIKKFVNEIREKTPDSSLWTRGFAYSWLASALDAASQGDNEVRGFKGITHSRYVDDFVHLDEERISVAAERVRRAHGLRAIEAMNAHPDQQQLIKAEAAKVKKHLPLRKVFAQAAEVLTAVCPCWMASPLSVSQLLDGGKQYFDFVIFDEASQVLPEDAVPAVLRGKQLVVAGDNHQLPPTTFFAASDDDDYAADEEQAAAEGFESLLDMMMPFVRNCHLNWHYRSRDETLINFSNHYIYQDRLVTFPGPGGPAVIDHDLVQQEIGVDGQEDSSASEVNRVIELIFRHAHEHPKETLGVITMGIKHMNRVQATLDRELEKRSDLESFFDPNLHERFFIKNLERVQGDERDAIIISIGYGKDRAGNLPMRFGPLLSKGGRRRLNVAITRARQKLTVVSAFTHLDIDLTRVRPDSGVEMLRNYLQYAASKGKRLGDAQQTTVPLNEFEADVSDVLTAQGIKLIPQLGASQFRIDLVAEHPQKPGRFVLAVECDGATYHSSYTARDRDRLRQQQLENLGWRFHRIWSTDWFMRKEEEVKRFLDAFQAAVRYADNLDAGIVVSSDDGHGKSRTSEVENAHPSKRGPRPPIPMRTSISQYSQQELGQFIRWISSDGRLRTDEEIIVEMIAVLGFSRRGARIDAAVKSALQIYRT